MNQIVNIPVFTHLRTYEGLYCGALTTSVHVTDDIHDVTCPECVGLIRQVIEDVQNEHAPEDDE